MKLINKSISNGVVRINELSFMQFSNAFSGKEVVSRKSGRVIPRFQLFWWGLTVTDVKRNFEVRPRNDN